MHAGPGSPPSHFTFMDSPNNALTIDLQAFGTSALHARMAELRRYL